MIRLKREVVQGINLLLSYKDIKWCQRPTVLPLLFVQWRRGGLTGKTGHSLYDQQVLWWSTIQRRAHQYRREGGQWQYTCVLHVHTSTVVNEWCDTHSLNSYPILPQLYLLSVSFATSPILPPSIPYSYLNSSKCFSSDSLIFSCSKTNLAFKSSNAGGFLTSLLVMNSLEEEGKGKKSKMRVHCTSWAYVIMYF